MIHTELAQKVTTGMIGDPPIQTTVRRLDPKYVNEVFGQFVCTLRYPAGSLFDLLVPIFQKNCIGMPHHGRTAARRHDDSIHLVVLD